MKKKNLQDAIDGYYLCSVLKGLQSSGIFEHLSTPITACELAAVCGVSESILSGLLEFLCEFSDIVRRKSRGRFVLSPEYRAYRCLGFGIDKQVLAADAELKGVDRVLSGQTLTRNEQRGDLLASAFETIEGETAIPASGLLSQMEAKYVVDLGCGVGKLLRDMALNDGEFLGVGVDNSVRMVQTSRRRNMEVGISRRVRVLKCDVRRLATRLGPSERKNVDVVHGKDIFNEFSNADGQELIELLRQLRKLFPGRSLLLSDYYGKLGQTEGIDGRFSITLLHDVFQLLSGQGVPPPNLEAWCEIYAKSGCDVEECYSGVTTGVEWFVHKVRL